MPSTTFRLVPVALSAVFASMGWAAAQTQPKPAARPPAQVKAFAKFLDRVKLRWDEVWLYIESNGLPDHEMMTKIRTWQQQVPLAQDYTGANAWQVPRTPVPAKEPLSAKTGFFRGAIAIAVNGVPIFNPIKNDGVTDTFLAGELDLFGGHAGRADDYHYHLAPVFLNGGDPSRPVAFALDGYPIYGYDEPDGSPCRPLDEWNGHDDPKLGYHYHATREYPYLNGGFRGEVREAGGQVEPQPHEHPVRPATTPLRGAVVTGFTRSEDGKTCTLRYEQRGRTGTVEYSERDDGSVHFVFTTPDGTRTEQTYRRDQRPRGDRREVEQPRPRAQQPAPARTEANARQPWLAAHFAELDGDRDAVLTRVEVESECNRTLAGFDRDGDRRIVVAERDAAGAGRSALGGFVRQHWQEVDADGDDVVTGDEVRANTLRMFQRADRDRDERLTVAEAGQGGGGGEARGQRGGVVPGRGYAVLEPTFHTDVPDHPFDAILANPTPTSITVSVVSHRHGDARIEFAAAGASATPERTTIQHLHEGLPARFELRGLKPDTAYTWTFAFRPEASDVWQGSERRTFHTPRPATASFTFTVTADTHLDENVSTAVYANTLANAAADRPDFHIDLGDTFMTDKRRVFRDAAPQYTAQRYWFGQLCDSVPLYLALGNHDGENGFSGTELDEIAGWSFGMRTMHFPSPETSREAGAMYTGRTSWSDDGGAHYYAFHWGPALCLVLDPFWATVRRARSGGGEVELDDESWRMTLGRAQYDWLASTLAASKAPFRFVFLHHLVGGRSRVARGGAEAAPYFEWGGRNADGSDGFAAQRPGWPVPIHRLLVQHGVQAVFHGHDHLYVRNELDGIVYQCVPQPGNARGGTRSAAEYGYTSGTILGSPGHLRVQVTPEKATVAFVRSVVGDTAARERRATREPNRAIVHEYVLQSRTRQ
ncbi:MAG: metallophosphoesterase [Planctomycetes bacterium]|nr:metallophosphoesterase [Planctomycetota bacterium]